MAMAVAQDGSGFPFFATCLYDYICGKDLTDIEVDIEMVPDAEAYILLSEVSIKYIVFAYYYISIF